MSAKHPVTVPYRVSTEKIESKTEEGTIWVCAEIQNKVDESVSTGRYNLLPIYLKAYLQRKE